MEGDCRWLGERSESAGLDGDEIACYVPSPMRQASERETFQATSLRRFYSQDPLICMISQKRYIFGLRRVTCGLQSEVHPQ